MEMLKESWENSFNTNPIFKLEKHLESADLHQGSIVSKGPI